MEGKPNSYTPPPDTENEVSAAPPKPRRYLYGRPVYSEEELLEMDPFLPPEPEFISEWQRRKALKEKR